MIFENKAQKQKRQMVSDKKLLLSIILFYYIIIIYSYLHLRKYAKQKPSFQMISKAQYSLKLNHHPHHAAVLYLPFHYHANSCDVLYFSLGFSPYGGLSPSISSFFKWTPLRYTIDLSSKP